MDDILEKLKELGFNSYEGKAYLALLKKYPATGYEVAQIADIPQSRAYDALNSLVAFKAALATDDKPKKFIPVSSKELTRRFRRKMTSIIDFLEKKLPDVKQDYTEPVHNIAGYENIIKKLDEIITNAQKSIYLEIWSEEFKHLEPALTNAYDRGVDIKIIGYNNFKSPFGLIYIHDGGKEIEHQLGSRFVYLLADDEETVFGRIEFGLIWTNNTDIAFLVKNFIVHDMYLLDIYKHFPEQLKYFYGIGFVKLKEKILIKNSGFDIQ